MDPLQRLIGRSPKMQALREELATLLARAAGPRRLPPCLITGETGTGKGLLARILHEASSRSERELVELSGAAIPEHLLESELFGYERGAFTDARQAKAGLLHAANGGTLFLDEVGLLPLSLQAKLLKVLEDDSVRRLGSTRSEPIDVWIVSATNEDLVALVDAKRFREDLYHRLAALTLSLPPLREREGDIDILADLALARACAKYGVSPKTLTPEARTTLRAYRWPGNVRELNSAVERAVLLTPASTLSAAALGLSGVRDSRSARAGGGEREQLQAVLTGTGWNISRTAAELGVTRNTVRARIARYGLQPPHGAEPAAEVVAPASRSDTPGAPGARTEAVLPSSGRPAIAVLPFRGEDDDPAGAYFGDGVVEDIIGALASLRELVVISRTSTLRYRGTSVDVRAVGRELGVTYALSGSIRRDGHRLRVSGELAETARGTVVWASHFDGIADDLFALQDHIVAKVAATIAPQVREAELRRALRKRPGSLEAYDCLLRALADIYRLNPDEFGKPRRWLEKAIELDPAYAAPYAWFAIWHSIRLHQGWSPDAPADRAEVIRLATAALERDSFDAMALALAGHAKAITLYEFDEAIALFDRALAASPSSALAWTRSSPTYSYIGDAGEAIRRAEQGLRLSPLDVHIFYPHSLLGLAFYVAGEHDEGARWGQVAREENARYTANLRVLAANLAAAGRSAEAREAGRALLALEPAFEVGPFIARYAIRDPERQSRLARHLRLAGLPG